MQGWWAASYIVLWFVVIVLSVLVVALARQIGTLHLRLGPRGALEIDSEGPALGEAPPAIEARDIEGRARVIGGPGEAQLLLFVSPGCRMCEQVLPAIKAVADAGKLAPFIVTEVDHEEAALTFSKRRLPAPVVSSPETARTYAIPGTPFVVALDSRGIVRAKGTVNNLEQMEGLVDTARRRLTGDEHERRAS